MRHVNAAEHLRGLGRGFLLELHPRQLKFPTGAPVSQPYLCHLFNHFCRGFSHKDTHRAQKMPDGEISRQKGEPEEWLIAVTTAKETCSVAPELSQSHRSCGELLHFSCRLGLQATSADHVIGFRVVGHVENRATFPVHCFPWDERILHRSLQRNLSNKMPGPICSGRNHTPAFRKC